MDLLPLAEAPIEGRGRAFLLEASPFHLPGNVRHVSDFIEFWTDGTVYVVEIKGYDTPVGKLKRKQVEALYPITIGAQIDVDCRKKISHTPKVGRYVHEGRNIHG